MKPAFCAKPVSCWPSRPLIALVEPGFGRFLDTHCPSSLYEAFEPEEAKRILSHLELHYTPKHGSWLNMAEIELSILGRQCLSRRIPDQGTLRREVSEWQKTRNSKDSKIDWRFTTSDARIKLKKLYPSFQH